MKSIYKTASAFLLAGCLFLGAVFSAIAQRGHSSFRGGFHFGFGMPHFGFGFGYYRPYYAYPRLGFYINTLPYGYYPFYWGPDQYYYYGGTFYRPHNNGYEIAAPPLGVTVPKIPANAHPIQIDGQQYYELNGVYYKEIVDEKGKKAYIVSGKDGVLNTNDDVYDNTVDVRAPQVGDVVTQLPQDYHTVTLNGKRYYISPDGIYYEQFKDANNNTSYRIVSVPEDEQPTPESVPARQ